MHAIQSTSHRSIHGYGAYVYVISKVHETVNSGRGREEDGWDVVQIQLIESCIAYSHNSALSQTNFEREISKISADRYSVWYIVAL